MPRVVSGASRLRTPSRRELIIFTLLAAFIAIVEPFEPFDWVQSSFSAAFNAKDYRGDAIIVAIDAETEQSLPSKSWTRAHLAQLLTRIGETSPDVLVVDEQYFDDENPGEMDQLVEAISALPERPYYYLELPPEVAANLSEDSRVLDEGPLADRSARLDPDLDGLVRPAFAISRSYAFGAPILVPLAVSTEEGTFPSLATALAGGFNNSDRQVLKIDLSTRPGSIPHISAADILAGNFDEGALTGRKVIVSFTNTLGRDTRDTPNDSYTSKAALWVMAADTLERGPPVDIGWMPAFFIALLAGFCWMTLPRPYGRAIAAAALVCILASPFVLEKYLIFQQTSHGIFFLLLLAAGKVWQRVQNVVRTYRSSAETKSRFLAQASHDLRQPIHAIGLLAERLAQSDLTADQAKLVSKISWSVDNATRMFRALLDIAAIESGTLKADMRPVPINEVLAGIDSQNALSAEQAKVDLRLVPCDLVVRTDPALIGTMLQNLVSNAIKYSPGKAVVVGCRRRSGRLALYVVDNGRGISASDLEHVKKEFFRSSRRSTLGSDNKGLGLAIVSRLADMLDLKLSLRSREGVGTTATIEGLQIVENAAALGASQAERKMPLSGLHIALADDDEETLVSTRGLLEQWGCQVQMFRELPQDLPECDIMLSDFDFGDGNTLGSRADLVLQARESGTQFMVISGHHPDQIRSELPVHTGLILSKPLRAAELRSALMSVRQGEKNHR